MKLFFWASGENYQYYESRPRCAKHERENSVRLLLTKTPPIPSIAPGARSTVSRLNGSRGSGRQLDRYRAPLVLLV